MAQFESLYQQQGTPDIYAVSGGQKYKVATPEALQQLNVQQTGILSAPSSYLAGLPMAGTITPESLASGGQYVDFAKAPVNTQSISNATTTATGQQKTYEQLMKEWTQAQTTALEQATKQQEAYQKQSEGLMGKISDVLTQKQALQPIDTQAIYEQELAKFGVTPQTFSQMNALLPQIQNINQQIASVEAEKQQLLFSASQRQTTTDVIYGQQGQIERQYAIKQSALAGQALALTATLEAMRGNVTMASNLATNVVNMATWKYQQQVSDLEWAFNTYSTLFQIMDKKEQNAWDRAYTIQKDLLDRKSKQVETNMQLVLDAASKGVNMGLNMEQIENMSYGDISAIYSKMVGEQQAKFNALEMQQAQANLALTQAQRSKILSDISQAGKTTGTTGAKYEDRLSQEIKNVFSGLYGTTGAREQAIRILKNEFPNINVEKDVYARLPDGWEKNVGLSTATQLTSIVKQLPVGQQDAAFSSISSFQTGQRLLDLLQGGQVKTGLIQGSLGKIGQVVSGKNQAFNDFVAGSTAFTAEYIKALSGVQVSDKERQFLLNLLPTAYKQEDVNIAGIKTALQRLQDKYEQQLGIKFSDYPDVIPSIGTLKVKEISSGRTGTIPENEFDPALYEIIQ